MKFNKQQSWNELIHGLSSDMKPLELCGKILSWAKFIKQYCNEQELKIYDSYITYFEGLDLSEYDYGNHAKWYTIAGVLNKIQNHDCSNLTGKFIACRDVLHEILIFMSNRECKVEGICNLRVYGFNNSIVFCCDRCFYCEDLLGNGIEIEGMLLPATAAIVKKFEIVSSLY